MQGLNLSFDRVSFLNRASFDEMAFLWRRIRAVGGVRKAFWDLLKYAIHVNFSRIK